MPTVLYANAVGLRLGVSDFGLFLATRADPGGQQIDATNADVAVYMSPPTAKLLSSSLTKAVAAYEDVTGGAIPTGFQENAEEKLVAAFAGMLGVELRKGGGADATGLPR